MTMHLMPTYARLPVAFGRGEGVWLWDTAGKRYLDGLSGIAVNGLGHGHPRFVRALMEQATRLIHASNLYRIPEQEQLADLLCALAKMDNVFFCNSGCEANEAAIKLARLYGHAKGIEQPTIVVMEKAFHGRTLATLSATGSRKVQAGFEPLLAGFVRVPYNDVQTLEQVAVHNKNIVAVMVEPIQGEGGINIPDDGYLPHLRTACDRHGWLLILDEVQSGIGRTGRWFAHQLHGVKPDVMTLAKGLGNGIPIGACLASGAAAHVFHAGNHGSTFGGNPLACIAAHTTLSIIADERLTDNAVRIGDQIRNGLRERLSNVSHVRDIRGCGLMVGVDLTHPCASLVQKGLEHGILINVTADTVLRLLPPLIMQPGEAKQLIEGVCELVEQFVAEPAPAGVNG